MLFSNSAITEYRGDNVAFLNTDNEKISYRKIISIEYGDTLIQKNNSNIYSTQTLKFNVRTQKGRISLFKPYSNKFEKYDALLYRQNNSNIYGKTYYTISSNNTKMKLLSKSNLKNDLNETELYKQYFDKTNNTKLKHIASILLGGTLLSYAIWKRDQKSSFLVGGAGIIFFILPLTPDGRNRPTLNNLVIEYNENNR